MPIYQKEIKVKKQNIGMEEQPKMEIVGGYWDEEIVSQVVDLLK